MLCGKFTIGHSELPFSASVSNLLLMQNLSNESEFHFHENEPLGERHFHINRPLPSSLVPLFQNESEYETFWKEFCMQFIFIQISHFHTVTMVSHLDSLWNRAKGNSHNNGLLSLQFYQTRDHSIQHIRLTEKQNEVLKPFYALCTTKFWK